MGDWLPKAVATQAERAGEYRAMATKLRELAGVAISDYVRTELTRMADDYNRLADSILVSRF